MQLLDKVALVTGAAQGLGRSIALAMAREGANLVLCDLQEDKLAEVSAEIEALGRKSLALRCDVSSKDQVVETFARAAEHFGTVHILVNNAALVPNSPADEDRRSKHYAYVTTPMERQSMGITSSLTDEDWLKWWNVNVHGVFYCTREALKYMEPQGYGRIINIASIAGISTGSTHSPGYSAAKAAVVSLTKTVALDVAGAGIYVNAIACGGVLTPPFQAYLDNATEDEKRNLYQMIPVGRLGRPEEYASLAVYLAGENHYLVGQIISPNGGVVI
ncbi:short-chain dehydrogenase [Rhodococcus sp. SRB_17]|uniref:SDR family NAD(P)-dependent oxidoreductase n=1 Tax=Rhodococcus sp. OK302 TaxID=1882769 RepID=UPI000B93CAB4|nr:SDR family NAD(P)-dependent oxidoreductase [Rhodococcus sp. OK302]NMM90820.1 short-chain dehydrogenase [Rhodococcus sp. SRB_17]OYD60721.1 3-oxoacyl-[acyl-carrier protein] reductase [Rhodococcus sp. OK302]OYD71094.1 3-oxoacyl-[acyl-carrier protein] reductase [Rhodococcus sp. OK302]